MAKFTLRLPDDLQESIQARADREHRSLHAQIIHLLSEAAQRGDAPSRYSSPSAGPAWGGRTPETIEVQHAPMPDAIRERTRREAHQRVIVVETAPKDALKQ